LNRCWWFGLKKRVAKFKRFIAKSAKTADKKIQKDVVLVLGVRTNDFVLPVVLLQRKVLLEFCKAH
jgi:hypothetical protein